MSLRDPLWGKREKSSGTERRFELLEVVPSAKSQHWFQAEGECHEPRAIRACDRSVELISWPLGPQIPSS